MTDQTDDAHAIADDIFAELSDGCPQMSDDQCELGPCVCEETARCFETRIRRAIERARQEAQP